MTFDHEKFTAWLSFGDGVCADNSEIVEYFTVCLGQKATIDDVIELLIHRHDWQHSENTQVLEAVLEDLNLRQESDAKLMAIWDTLVSQAVNMINPKGGSQRSIDALKCVLGILITKIPAQLDNLIDAGKYIQDENLLGSAYWSDKDKSKGARAVTSMFIEQIRRDLCS